MRASIHHRVVETSPTSPANNIERDIQSDRWDAIRLDQQQSGNPQSSGREYLPR